MTTLIRHVQGRLSHAVDVLGKRARLIKRRDSIGEKWFATGHPGGKLLLTLRKKAIEIVNDTGSGIAQQSNMFK